MASALWKALGFCAALLGAGSAGAEPLKIRAAYIGPGTNLFSIYNAKPGLAKHLGQVEADQRLVLGDQHTPRRRGGVGGTRGAGTHGAIVASTVRGGDRGWHSAGGPGGVHRFLRPGPSVIVGCHAIYRPPSYPNWQRKRIQNPCSESSNLSEGTKCRRLSPQLRSSKTVKSPWVSGQRSTGCRPSKSARNDKKQSWIIPRVLRSVVGCYGAPQPCSGCWSVASAPSPTHGWAQPHRPASQSSAPTAVTAPGPRRRPPRRHHYAARSVITVEPKDRSSRNASASTAPEWVRIADER